LLTKCRKPGGDKTSTVVLPNLMTRQVSEWERAW
jgi:hypothetical protein